MLPVWKGLGEANGKWQRLAFATGFAISLAKWQMHSSLAKARQTHRIRHRRMHFAEAKWQMAYSSTIEFYVKLCFLRWLR